MKKSLFIILFLLISMLLLYSPIKSVAQSPDCFLSQVPGFTPDVEEKVSLNYNYENTPTANWKASAQGEFFIQDLTYQGDLFERVLPASLADEQGNCKAYSFQFQREEKNLTFSANFTGTVVVNGTTYCYYSPEDKVGEVLEALQEIPMTICSNLQNVELTPGSECPQTAPCNIEINQGPQENYLFGVSSDSCGYVVETINGGNPVDDVSTSAANFINECASRVRTAGGILDANSGEIIPGSGEVNPLEQSRCPPGQQIVYNSGESRCEYILQEVSGCVAFFQQLFGGGSPNVNQETNPGNANPEAGDGGSTTQPARTECEDVESPLGQEDCDAGICPVEIPLESKKCSFVINLSSSTPSTCKCLIAPEECDATPYCSDDGIYVMKKALDENGKCTQVYAFESCISDCETCRNGECVQVTLGICGNTCCNTDEYCREFPAGSQNYRCDLKCLDGYSPCFKGDGYDENGEVSPFKCCLDEAYTCNRGGIEPICVWDGHTAPR